MDVDLLEYNGCLALLVAADTNPNTQNMRYVTALMWATVIGHDEIVRCLLKNGADTNIRDNDQRTSLHWAYIDDRPEIAELLLMYGADTTVKDLHENIPSEYKKWM